MVRRFQSILAFFTSKGRFHDKAYLIGFLIFLVAIGFFVKMVVKTETLTDEMFAFVAMFILIAMALLRKKDERNNSDIHDSGSGSRGNGVHDRLSDKQD